MKYLFHLILILLSAFIIAGLYEVYVIRDGNLQREDLLESSVQKLGGWGDVLHGEANLSDIGSDFFSSFFDKDSNDFESDEDLMQKFSTGSIGSLEGLLDDSNQDKRFVVIEYCPHSEDICKQSAKAGLRTYFENTLTSAGYYIRPFMGNIGGINELIRAGEVCVPFEKLATYHEEIYSINSLNADSLAMIGKKLKVEDFGNCLEEINIKLALRNQIQRAKDAFSISSIPSFVVVDTKTNKRTKIPGLYSLDQIDALMSQEHPEALKTTVSN